MAENIKTEEKKEEKTPPRITLSKTSTCAEIEARNFDLKAVNPNAKVDEDKRTPSELLDLIEAKGREVSETLKKLVTGR